MTNPAPSQRLAAVTAAALAAVVVLARRHRPAAVVIDLRVTIDRNRPTPLPQPPDPAQLPRADTPGGRARRGHLRVVPARGTSR